MFKKISVFVLIAITGLFMSGCIKYKTTIEINKKDQLTITQRLTFDKRGIKDSESENFEYALSRWNDFFEKEKDQKYDVKGFKAKKIRDGNIEGRIYTKTCKKANFLAIEDLPDGFTIPSDANNPIVINKMPFGTRYRITLAYNPKKIKQTNYSLFDKEELYKIGISDETIKPLLKKSTADLTIKIPRKARKHNATKVNEKTHEYYWELGNFDNLDKQKEIPIYIEYGKINFLSILILLAILIWTYKVIKKNKDFKPKNDDETKDAF